MTILYSLFAVTIFIWCKITVELPIYSIHRKTNLIIKAKSKKKREETTCKMELQHAACSRKESWAYTAYVMQSLWSKLVVKSLWFSKQVHNVPKSWCCNLFNAAENDYRRAARWRGRKVTHTTQRFHLCAFFSNYFLPTWFCSHFVVLPHIFKRIRWIVGWLQARDWTVHRHEAWPGPAGPWGWEHSFVLFAGFMYLLFITFLSEIWFTCLTTKWSWTKNKRFPTVFPGNFLVQLHKVVVVEASFLGWRPASASPVLWILIGPRCNNDEHKHLLY